jgi:DNA-binding protein YbaB
MLDKLKAMGALAGVMKNQEGIRQATERVKVKLAAARLTGESGSGACRVTVSGDMKVLSVELAPALVRGMAADDKTRELASNLIVEATNSAMQKAQATIAENVQAEANGLGLGDLVGNFKGLVG